MIQNQQPVHIRPVGGLCNRLRFIFSVRRIIRPTPLRVNWHVNQICPGRFEELFEPVPGVEISPHRVENAWVGSQDFARQFIRKPSERKEIYEDLLFKPQLRQLTERDGLDDTIAFHIRRSDFHGAGLTNKRLLQLAEGTAKEYKHVFLATCDEGIQHMFQQKFGDRLLTNGEFEPPSLDLPDHPSSRETSLLHAGLDLLTAVRCRRVLGTKGSAFTDMIFDLRGQQRVTFEELNDGNEYN